MKFSNYDDQGKHQKMIVPLGMIYDSSPLQLYPHYRGHAGEGDEKTMAEQKTTGLEPCHPGQ